MQNNTKNRYFLIEKYIAREEQFEDFCSHFSEEQLNYFEKTLYLYFETDDIDFNKNEGCLYSKSNTDFNSNIIYLAEGNLSYTDFLQDYIESLSDLSLSSVIEYFRENEIKDLMNYGSDKDEGLSKLSSMYGEILDNMYIEYSNIYTEDGMSDGKYLTTITFEDDSKIELDTSAWNGIKTVAENIESVCEFYEKTQEKVKENKSELEVEL